MSVKTYNTAIVITEFKVHKNHPFTIEFKGVSSEHSKVFFKYDGIVNELIGIPNDCADILTNELKKVLGHGPFIDRKEEIKKIAIIRLNDDGTATIQLSK